MIVHTCSFCSYLIKGAKWHPKLLKVRCKSQSKEVQLGTPNHEKEVLMKKQGPDLRYLRRAIRRGRFFGIYGLIEPYFTWSLNIDHWFTGEWSLDHWRLLESDHWFTGEWALDHWRVSIGSLELPKRPICPNSPTAKTARAAQIAQAAQNGPNGPNCSNSPNSMKCPNGPSCPKWPELPKWAQRPELPKQPQWPKQHELPKQPNCTNGQNHPRKWFFQTRWQKTERPSRFFKLTLWGCFGLQMASEAKSDLANGFVLANDPFLPIFESWYGCTGLFSTLEKIKMKKIIARCRPAAAGKNQYIYTYGKLLMLTDIAQRRKPFYEILVVIIFFAPSL